MPGDNEKIEVDIQSFENTFGTSLSNDAPVDVFKRDAPVIDPEAISTESQAAEPAAESALPSALITGQTEMPAAPTAEADGGDAADVHETADIHDIVNIPEVVNVVEQKPLEGVFYGDLRREK